MTQVSTDRSRHSFGGFADGRAAASRAEAAQRILAARTVAHNALDMSDRSELLSMLGLPDPTSSDVGLDE